MGRREWRGQQGPGGGEESEGEGRRPALGIKEGKTEGRRETVVAGESIQPNPTAAPRKGNLGQGVQGAPSGPQGPGYLFVHPGAGEGVGSSRRGLSGQYLLGFHRGLFWEVGAGSGLTVSQVDAVPLSTPRSASSRSVQCYPRSSWYDSQVITFPNAQASPSPALATTTPPGARPSTFLSPRQSPAVPSAAKTNSPEGPSRSAQWPRRHTREDKRGGPAPGLPQAE